MKYLITLVGLVIAGFLYWAVAPYFTETVVEEELAIDISQFQDVSQRETTKVSDQQEEKRVSVDDTEPEPLPEQTSPAVQVVKPKETTPAETIITEPQTVEAPKPTLYQGNFIDADPTHQASGNVYISGSNLSLVNFDSTNVPDGFVYLSNDLDARDSVRLAKLKGSKGNQNYVLPSGVDAGDYKYVLIWCRAFSVLVGSAQIN